MKQKVLLGKNYINPAFIFDLNSANQKYPKTRTSLKSRPPRLLIIKWDAVVKKLSV